MFIVIEGPDKIGKASAIGKLQHFFSEPNLSELRVGPDIAFPKIVIFVKELSRDIWSKELLSYSDASVIDVKNIVISTHADSILKSLRSDMGDDTKACLWLGARIETLRVLADHLNTKYGYKIDCSNGFAQLTEVMKSKDVLIIYNQFVTSTIAHQGTTEEMRDNIYTMHEMGRIPKPDITFILTESKSNYRERISVSNNEYKILQFDEQQDRLLEVFDIYRKMTRGIIESYSDNVDIIGTSFIDTRVTAIVFRAVANFIKGNRTLFGINIHNLKIGANVKDSEEVATDSGAEKEISEAAACDKPISQSCDREEVAADSGAEKEISEAEEACANSISGCDKIDLSDKTRISPSSTVARVDTGPQFSRYAKDEDWWNKIRSTEQPPSSTVVAACDNPILWGPILRPRDLGLKDRSEISAREAAAEAIKQPLPRELKLYVAVKNISVQKNIALPENNK